MSGAQTSPFLTTNELLAPMAADHTHANALLQQQQRTQDITDHDIAAVGQAAAPLLNLNEDQAAAAYPAWLQDQQSRGIAKYAPSTYPGHAAVQALVQRAMPILQQIQTGFFTPPGSADATKRINDIYTGAGATTGGGTGAAATGAGPAAAPAVPSYGGGPGNLPVPQEYMPYFQEASQRTGIPVDLLIAQARQESGFNPGATGGAGEIGIMQIHPKTAANPGFGMTGVQNPDVLRDPRTNINFGADYLKARAGGADLTTPQGQAAALHAYNGGGDPNYVANVFRYMPAGGPAVATAGAPGSTTAARQPVVTGDSLASPAGLGGSGVARDSPAKVLARVQAESRAGKYDGQPVVLSTGASNNPTDLASVEQQIREAQAGNAGRISVLGVGPAVEAKAPGTNAKLQALATSYGAQFVPLPADQMSPDGVHPTAQGYATLKAAVAPSQGAPGGVAAPAPYQVASNAPVPPPASTAPTAGSPGAPPAAGLKYNTSSQGAPAGTILGYLPNGNAILAGPTDSHVGITGWNADGTPIRGGATAAATPQPQAQIPQPPANRAMPGGPDGPPAAQQIPAQSAPAPQQPTAAAARANLPRAADVPQGLNSPQIQQAQRLQQAASQIEIEAAQNPFDKRMQADAATKAAALRQQADILMKTDTVVQTQDGQLHVATGVIDKPVPHFVWDEKQGAYVDTTGSTAPVTPPSPRLLNVEGVGVVQSKPGGGATLVVPQNTAGITAAEASKALGKATGTDVAKQVPQYMQIGQRADQAINVIDSGLQHLSEAAKGNIPSGYFAPWLATGAAALKSLGVDLTTLGIDPKAVGDVQTAQKTLGIVSGAILQNTLGKDSQITDAKVEHFIHTQPDLAMDPNALSRILQWARTQFVFEHDMAIDAMKTAATSPSGTLPLNWAPGYFAAKGGFGPIYNPLTGQSALPTGEGVPREPPASQPTGGTIIRYDARGKRLP